MAHTPTLLAFLDRAYANRDASHDAHHVWRVARVAMRIAKAEGDTNSVVVFYAALFHDMLDAKYPFDRTAVERSIIKFLSAEIGMVEDEARRVIAVIDNVSYSKEVSRVGGASSISRELAAVQDADRLDALGAIGIARAFAYAGAHHESLRDAADHINGKLPRLAGLMKTETGRALAEERDAFVAQFMAHFDTEWNDARDD